MTLHTDATARDKLASYPPLIREKIAGLRDLIIEEAEAIEGLGQLLETLKWGELSYLTKKGSTIRIDWKERSPDVYAMYFNCNTSLVGTFRLVFEGTFSYEGNRALVFDLKDALPEHALRQCIRMALTYHQIKHLPLLGA